MKKPRVLSHSFCQRAPLGQHGDGRGGFGLQLRVKRRANGRLNKYFLQKIRIGGKQVCIGIGHFPLVKLREARQIALDNARAVRKGLDPRQPGVPSLREAVEAVLQIRSQGWKDGSPLPRRMRASFETYGGALGEKRVDQVSTSELLAILRPIWRDKPAAAKQLRSQLSQVFKWAIAQGYRQDNPAEDALGALPVNGGTTNHAALHHRDVAGALRQVRDSVRHAPTALCLEFLALTGVRSTEARGARWGEIDMAAAIWTVPSNRMKTRREHRVPLSSRALAILRDVRPLARNGLVFPAPRGGVLRGAIWRRLLIRLKVGGTVHGLRTSFRSWAAEQGVDRSVAEAALGHVVAGVEGAYQRSDLLERRRAVMQDWADYLEG